MNITYLAKNIFRDDNRIKGFNENHLLLLVYLQKFTTFQGKIYFIFNFLFDDFKIDNKPLRKELYQCLQDLQKWGLINITNKVDFESINKNTIIILDGVQYEDNYTMLIASEVDKILYSDEDIRSRKTMLYIYTLIVSRIDGKGFCFPRLSMFKKDLSTTSDNRIINAIDKLKELDLIDYANCGIVKDVKGRIFQGNNIYVTTYTKNYSEILKNAVNSNREYHQENNSVVMQKRKREDTYSVAKVSKIEIDDKIINYNYKADYAKLIVSWIREGLKNNEDVSANYEKLLKFYNDEINYKPKENNVVELPKQEEEKEDDTLDWIKEVEEREKFYSEFENNKEEKTILDVFNQYRDYQKYELPF